MAAAIATFQKSPLDAPEVIGIFILEDDKIFLKTKKETKVCKSVLINSNRHFIAPSSELYLKELARQDKLSQISYFYIEDESQIAYYEKVLTGDTSNGQ